MPKPATISFRTSDEVAQQLERLYAHFYSSRLRLDSGLRLKKQEILSSLIAYAGSLDAERLEKIIEEGLELAKIPFQVSKPA